MRAEPRGRWGRDLRGVNRVGRTLVFVAMLGGAVAPIMAAAGIVGARIGAEVFECHTGRDLDLPARASEDQSGSPPPVLHEAQARSCAARLLRQLRARAEQAFIDEHGLHATEAEVDAVRAYERAFARHDRAQRERKLDEVKTRLIHMGPEMSAAERARLIEFHAVLERLAAYEADVAHGKEPEPQTPIAVVKHWIEQVKLDPLLFKLYGGAVGLRASGAYAHSARAALVLDYLARDEVEVPHPEIARRLRALLSAPPAIVYRGGVPDFTPFWQRPLVPSYVAP